MHKAIIAAAVLTVIAACSADDAPTVTTVVPGVGDPIRGAVVFDATCITCHGPGGVGVPGLGKPLTTSGFADGLSDAELLAFLEIGRPADDPLNTTGIAMPPRGGNPALTDADLIDVIAYVRTLGE